MQKNEKINIQAAAEILKVSIATIKNWVKNGSLQKTTNNDFLLVDVLDLKEKIELGKIERLNSRRNKLAIKGIRLNKKYLLNNDLYNIAYKIVNSINFSLTSEEIKIILCEYSLKIIVFLNKFDLKEEIYLKNIKKLKNYFNNLTSFKVAMSFLEDINNFEEKIEKIKNILIFELPKINYLDDFIGLLYMGLKSLKERKTFGVYYTPTKIVNTMLEKIQSKMYNNPTIIDICCGSGNFLLSALKIGFKYKNIYGIDIDEISIKIARLNIALNFKNTDYNVLLKNLISSNSLEYNKKQFDFCIGNPPWGSILDKNENLNLETLNQKNVDSFDLFLEKGIDVLKNEGILYYVVPEALINVVSHKYIRQILEKKSKLLNVIFWGEIFDGVQTPAISIMVQKEKFKTNNDFELNAEIQIQDNKFLISKKRKSNNWIIKISDDEYSILETINNSNNYFYLKNNAIFAMGLVTGNNKKFLFSKPFSTTKSIIKGSNIFKYKIAKENLYLDFKPNEFHQIAKENLYLAKEKLIYRFISNTLVFAYDDKQRLSLNSANILIPNNKEFNIKYILAILNSSFAHFFFKKTFNSIKVLRNHIENIPIPIVSKDKQNKIIGIVNDLLDEKNNNRLEIYNKLDEIILDLYKLTKEEKNIIKKNLPKNIFLDF
ncbi:TaqI-like C-terminal specificity domain-containing protein [Mycoplasmopsis lipophila]|uniref:TaqI-like C-terminal specificity domain-containing protein n=1 Tax=Mycoplasmopsis lipophila TaxID=2117 RepID=UPI003872FFC4